MSSYPQIIQGGMGAGVSNWRLARAVAQTGQLGVVSGTALDQILARRLQDGDRGGYVRFALDHFPAAEIAERIWNAYYIPGGKPEDQAYKRLPMHTRENSRELVELCMVGNFVEVFLASQGHDNAVGVNHLEKIQIPHLPSLYGAMLAGVAYVLMGAGIPYTVPGVLDRLAQHQSAVYALNITGSGPGDDTSVSFAPRDYISTDLPPLARPKFLAIVSSNTLAKALVKRANGKIDGFVVEGPTAGGHNAPPRGKLDLSQQGEPIYGERDRPDLAQMRELGLPFWLAGEYGTATRLRQALAAGAAGVQVGTAFAFCAESGLRDDYKQALLRKAIAGTARVFTDPVASPTNFPFKIVRLEGTNSEPADYLARPRICDLGYLREPYQTAEGQIGYRCAAEPVTVYVSKGGKAEDTAGRKCLCNALLADIGLPQIRSGRRIEAGLVTSGDDLSGITRFLPANRMAYTAADVVARLLEPAILPQPLAATLALAQRA